MIEIADDPCVWVKKIGADGRAVMVLDHENIARVHLRMKARSGRPPGWRRENTATGAKGHQGPASCRDIVYRSSALERNQNRSRDRIHTVPAGVRTNVHLLCGPWVKRQGLGRRKGNSPVPRRTGGGGCRRGQGHGSSRIQVETAMSECRPAWAQASAAPA